MRSIVREIMALSHRTGADPMLVLAGGGNSSAKDGNDIWVKASGFAMRDIPAEGFLRLDLARILAILDARDLPEDRAEREDEIARRQLAARIDPPDPGLRPTVEAMLHALIPLRFVMHTHPEVVGWLISGRDGEAAARRLGIPYLWIPYIDPGLPLARRVRREVEGWMRREGEPPRVILLAKHGLIVAGDTTKEIERTTGDVIARVKRLARARARKKARAAARILPDAERKRLLAIVAPAVRGALAEKRRTVLYRPDLASFGSAPDGKRLALIGALSPDEIVYTGIAPVWLEVDPRADDVAIGAAARAAVEAFRSERGQDPKVVLVPGLGGFAIGRTPGQARSVGEIYESYARVRQGTAPFGGPLPLTRREAQFIDTWSVENYRRKLAEPRGSGGRAPGLVAIVTGAGRGVGREIALGLAAQGASVVVADVDGASAKETAGEIAAAYGADRARSIVADVTNPESAEAMVACAVEAWGGIDLLVANAGILKAFKITEFAPQVWRAITDVNLYGYFVSARAAARVMRHQRSGDIIQINSKSGKKGSKYNSAYAASKFGGIGLTQSIAMDLAEDGIRVNAICPGNFFDLPLWSAPGGLFDQYRPKYGNVSREEVRKIYMARIPMGRGCTVPDIVTTILYILEQEYETGQAYNVTGGEEMH
ncbi:MAG: SDR family NAD(P)-dependent oxidoreductase [Planctomycetes bacterium]|nr:SDR family NAD(P)-dependent oxidoreductase [Planctomycetota bacterium]